MRRPRLRRGAGFGAVLVGLLALSLSACPGGPALNSTELSDAQLTRLIDSSGAVFVGRVVTRGTRTTHSVPASRFTAVVTVLAIAPPESLSLFKPNDKLTLRVSDTTSLFENTTYAFAGNILALDTGIVVGETVRLDASTPDLLSSALSRLRTARATAEDARLQEHLADADVVVLGTVDTVTTAAVDSSRRGAERADWKVARVDVRYRWRGDTKGTPPRIDFYFVGSRNVRFAGMPRPSVNDSAVFIGHRGELRFAGGKDSTVTFLLHPIDMLPVADAMRIDRSIRRRR